MVKAKAILTNGKIITLPLVILEESKKISVILKREATVNENIDVISFESEITKTNYNENGSMFYPTTPFSGFVLTNLSKRENAEFTSYTSWMPTAGICDIESSVFVMFKGGAADAKFHISVKYNIYSITPQIELNGDNADEDIVIEYYLLKNASYSDMAKIYRDYQIKEKGCIPIVDRAKSNPYLKYALDSIEFRIRMGWKPVPSPVLHQTPETEPPLKIVCDIAKIKKIVTEMHRQGIKKAEICLIGWSAGGHDGRYPQNYPLDERYGSEEELRDLIKYTQSIGYNIVCYTNSICAFEIAENWDENALTHRKDENGNIYPADRSGYNKSGGLSGGFVYHLCAKSANEQYAAVDLPKIAEYGFKGLHFVDELTFCVPEKCYHPKHPISRKEAYEHYREIAKLSHKLFGGFQSEGWLDYFNSDVDYILYTALMNELPEDKNPLFDEIIPFWQLVYHGIVMSNPNSATVNYILKGHKERLKFIEYGGRPLMYLYSKFGDEKNWMGDIDLRCDADDEIAECVESLKKVADEYDALKDLQYAFMEKHKKISKNVYKIDYSDGTSITVDYNNKSYIVAKNNNIILERQL